MRSFICLGLVILLSGWTTAKANNNDYFNQTVQSWRGSHIKALVSRWGTPDSQISSPSGHTLYIYNVRGYHAGSSGPSQPSVGVHFSRGGTPVIVNEPNTNMTWNRGALSLTCRTGFEVNNAGTVIDVQSQGNGCFGDADFAAKYANPRARDR